MRCSTRQIAFGSRARRGGFSLIEVLSALTIFSVGVVAMLEGIGQTTVVQSGMLFRREAGMLAENVLEETISLGVWEVGEAGGDFGEVGGQFSWSRQIELTDVADMWWIAVTVSWDFGAGETTLETYVFVPPPEEEPPL